MEDTLLEDEKAVLITSYGVYDAREAASRTITAGELIEALKWYDEDTPILFDTETPGLYSTISTSFMQKCGLVMDPDTKEEAWEEVW